MRKRKYFILLAILLVLASVGCEREMERNRKPNKPVITAGPDSGYKNISYSFTVSTTDPNNDNIYYQFNWDDGNVSFWSNFVPSGTPVTINHKWQITGIFSVKARAKDMHGLESYWSDAHIIVIREEK